MKIDQSIAVVQAEFRRKQAQVKRIEKKTELSEAEKISIGDFYKLQRAVNELITATKRAQESAFGRIPPHDMAMEQAVLGAIMLHSEPVEGKTVLSKVRGFLLPGHFYDSRHELIYGQCISLPQTDMRSIVSGLRKAGYLEEVGGPVYVAELTGRVSSSARIESDSRILIQFALKRRMIMLGSKLIESNYDDMTDALQNLSDLEDETLQLLKWVTK